MNIILEGISVRDQIDLYEWIYLTDFGIQFMSDNILNNARGRAIVANYNFWTHADQNLNQINLFTIFVTNVGFNFNSQATHFN